MGYKVSSNKMYARKIGRLIHVPVFDILIENLKTAVDSSFSFF